MIVWILAEYRLPDSIHMRQWVWPLHAKRVHYIGATPELALQSLHDAADMEVEIVSDDVMPMCSNGWPGTEGLSWRLLFTRWLTGEEWLVLYPMVVKTE